MNVPNVSVIYLLVMATAEVPHLFTITIPRTVMDQLNPTTKKEMEKCFLFVSEDEKGIHMVTTHAKLQQFIQDSPAVISVIGSMAPEPSSNTASVSSPLQATNLDKVVEQPAASPPSKLAIVAEPGKPLAMKQVEGKAAAKPTPKPYQLTPEEEFTPPVYDLAKLKELIELCDTELPVPEGPRAGSCEVCFGKVVNFCKWCDYK